MRKIIHSTIWKYFLVSVPDQIIPIERLESTENRNSLVSESGTRGLTVTQLPSFIVSLALDCKT